jgi:uncharacterized protein (TIGR02246 family)
LLGGFVVAVLILAACGGDDVDPAAVIEDYTAAYNAGDIDAVMALFSEESVVTGHPFALESEGLTAIRAVQVEDIAAAATENAYTISNVRVIGNTVTWDHVWISAEGGRFCQQGHSAVVEDGKITSWTWPGGSFGCPPGTGS